MRNIHEIASERPGDGRTSTYRVGDVVIDPRRGYLRRGDAEDLYLRPQTIQVLVYLLAHRDRVVGKEELHREIWGEVAVTDDALVQCVSDIRRALGDDSREQRIVKTIARIGYRFVASVDVSDETPAAPPLPETSPPPETTRVTSPVEAPVAAATRPRIWQLALLGAAALVIVSVVSALWQGRARISPETALTAAPGVHRVVVFYFENQSGSRTYDWLRQGLADMVITGLSRSENVAVLSRQQLDLLFERNGADINRPPTLHLALSLARQSGAESLVMGAFAEIGGALRFEARLHDARDGRLVGVESAATERPDELLTHADLVTLRVAGRLGIDVKPAGGGRLVDTTTNSLEAYRFYLLGLEKSDALESADAIRAFESALKLDPEFAMAAARIGYTYVVSHAMPDLAKPYLQRAFEQKSRLSDKDRSHIAAWFALANRDYPQAIEHFNEIVRRYPLEAEAWWRLGALLHGEGQTNEARIALQRGLAADPYHRQMANVLGTVYQTMGRHDDAIAMHRRYAELAPKEANAFDSLGLSYQYAGRYAEAIDAYRRAIALDRSFEVAMVHLGNTFVQLGRFTEAVEQYRRYIETAEYERDRDRGHVLIAWIEWRRLHVREAEAASARSTSPSAFELQLLDLARGRVEGVKRELQKYPMGANRGRRLTRRFEYVLQGEVAMHEARSTDAIAHFREALLHPPVPWGIDALDDCLADGLLRLRRFDEAVVEYQRVLGINPNLARARYGLARALDERNDVAASRVEYQRFVDIWRDADEELPELLVARRRLAALTTATR